MIAAWRAGLKPAPWYSSFSAAISRRVKPNDLAMRISRAVRTSAASNSWYGLAPPCRPVAGRNSPDLT